MGAHERTEQYLHTGDSASCCWNYNVFWHLDKCLHVSRHSLRLSTLLEVTELLRKQIKRRMFNFSEF